LVTRGAVFWLELEAEGRRPACVLTRDEAIPGLRNVVVALITGRRRGISSEVVLGSEDGMPRECVLSLDNLRTVPKAQLVDPITDLGPERLDELCRALAQATSCA
jgi:mRNA interferase MazF